MRDNIEELSSQKLNELMTVAHDAALQNDAEFIQQLFDHVFSLNAANIPLVFNELQQDPKEINANQSLWHAAGRAYRNAVAQPHYIENIFDQESGYNQPASVNQQDQAIDKIPKEKRLDFLSRPDNYSINLTVADIDEIIDSRQGRLMFKAASKELTDLSTDHLEQTETIIGQVPEMALREKMEKARNLYVFKTAKFYLGEAIRTLDTGLVDDAYDIANGYASSGSESYAICKQLDKYLFEFAHNYRDPNMSQSERAEFLWDLIVRHASDNVRSLMLLVALSEDNSTISRLLTSRRSELILNDKTTGEPLG